MELASSSLLLQLLSSSFAMTHVLFALLLLLLTLVFLKWPSSASTLTKNLPPSPRNIPILGHMHLLGTYPHRSLQKLAHKYGPAMMLQLGNVKTLVVSSAEAAQEIMKSQDLNFASRPDSVVGRKILYDYKDVASAPYGEYWRQMKSICVFQLLSNRKVQSFRSIRDEETSRLIGKISGTSHQTCYKSVNLSEMFMTLTNDIVCRATFGRKYSEGEDGGHFRKLIGELVSVLGGFEFATFLPWLGWIDHARGFIAKVERVAKEMDELLEGVLEEHKVQSESQVIEETEAEDGVDFAQVLIGIHNNNNNAAGFSIDRESVKALLLDMVSAGTDTTYTVLEWAMTRLLRHPQTLRKVQSEVRGIASGRSEISEKDLEKMKYLKAVIKETLRLHPPFPLLVPRTTKNDAKVMGFDIEAGSMVIVNAFAIGRDPSAWDQPEEFVPERFLTSSIDFRGHDFQLIPFGAGRRGCPGISFAIATIETVLANLVLKFDWHLPDGVEAAGLDMTECTGSTIHRKHPLLAVAANPVAHYY